MLYLQKPTLEDKEKYKDMIKEWQDFGGPYVPCIIDYDCNHLIDELDYNAVISVVENYSKGKVFDYNINHFECSDFYFIFDNDELIGMGEIRHNLKPLGKKTIGHIVCGIRPSKRKKGYGFHAMELMIEKLKNDNVSEIILCHNAEDIISSKMIKSLGFCFKGSVFSEINNKEIMCYTKKI